MTLREIIKYIAETYEFDVNRKEVGKEKILQELKTRSRPKKNGRSYEPDN